MDKYELDGETYYFNNGKWLTSNYMSVPTAVVGKLNKLLTVDTSKKSVHELIKLLDGAKQGENNQYALKIANGALEIANISEIRQLLPRVTSLYRKNNQAQKAIDVAIEYINRYGDKVESSALYTSMAAAYCDIDNLDLARKCVNRAMALSAGNSSAELNNVFMRLRILEGLE